MSAKMPMAPWLFAGAMMAVATSGMAEAPPWKSVPVKFTPEMIQQASKAAQPSQDRSYLRHKEYQTQELFRDTSKNITHVPNGCSQNSGSLCFDYRSGRAVYKPMRQLLPAIPGMTPHNLSIRRDKIVAQYTFK